MQCSIADLVCLHLDRAGETGGAVPFEASTPGISNAVGVDPENVAERIRLLSAIRELRREGLVAESVEPIAGTGEERNVYRLTDAGRERARAVRERAADETVVVDDGDRREISLADADELFEERPLVTALSRLTEEGVIYLDDGPGSRFVDREDPLETLGEVLAAVRESGPRTLLITGEEGVGKTTVLEELTTLAAEDGFAVLSGGCERDAAAPYAPLRRAFQDCPGDVDPAEPLAPVVAAGEQSDAGDRDAGAFPGGRTAAFHAVADRLGTAAAERPILVALDDLQWADPATVRLLATLHDELADRPVILAGSLRVRGEDGPLADLVDTVAASPRGEWIELDRFDRRATGELVARLTDCRSPPDAFVDLVHAHTGGNPLFVEETIRGLLAEGGVQPEYGVFPETAADLGVPEAVREVIELRLSALDEVGTRVLRTGSVIGTTIPHEVLAATLDLPDPELREYVDLLVEARIWHREGEGYRFTSGAIHDAVLSNVADEERRRLHRQVAETLRSADPGPPDPDYGRIAHHLTAAGDHEAALPYYERAGRYAREVYAHEDAVERYERALAIARDLPDHEAAILTYLEELGDTNHIVGDHEAAVRYYRYVRERTDDTATLQRVCWKQSKIQGQTGEYEASLRTAEDGLDRLDEPGGSILQGAHLYGQKGWALMDLGRLDEAGEAFRRGEELAREHGSDIAIGGALYDRGVLAATVGDAEAADSLLREAVDRLRGADKADEGWVEAGLIAEVDAERDPMVDTPIETLSVALSALGSVRRDRGDLDGALAHLEESLAIREQTGDESGRAATLANLGTIYGSRGEYEAARARHEEAREIAERLGLTADAGLNAGNVAYLELKRGNVAAALERGETAREKLEAVGNQPLVGWIQTILAAIRYYRGDLDRAGTLAERARETTDSAGDREEHAHAMVRLGDVRRARGDLDGAVAAHEDGLAVATDVGATEKAVVNRLALADDLRCRADYDRAADCAGRAIEDARSLENVFLVDAARIAVGAVARDRGNHDAAARHLTAALDRQGECGGNLLVARALFELASLDRKRGADDRARRRRDRAETIVEDGEIGLFERRFSTRPPVQESD